MKHAPTEAELLIRLKAGEDNFTEFKSSAADRDEIREAVVAFANTVPAPLVGVLFIGAKNDGTPTGHLDGANESETERKIGEFLERLCPPVPVMMKWLTLGGHKLLAIIVPESSNKPHFTAPAYVRRDSRSVKVCDEALDLLVASRSNIAWVLSQWLEPKMVTISHQYEPGGGFGRRSVISNMAEVTLAQDEGHIVEVNAHWLIWKIQGTYYSAPLAYVELFWDTLQNRLQVIVPSFKFQRVRH